MLQGQLLRQELEDAVVTLEQMRMRRISISKTSAFALPRNILRPRKPGKNPISTPCHREDLRLATRLLMMGLESGGDIPPEAWREVLRRHGKTGKLNDLELLAHWLVSWYSPDTTQHLQTRRAPFGTSFRSTSLTSKLPGNTKSSDSMDPLYIIFSRNFQTAIVDWGFLNPSSRDFSTAAKLREWELPYGDPMVKGMDGYWKRRIICRPQLSWDRGLRLLEELHKKGIYIHWHIVRRACEKRFRNLYSDDHCESQMPTVVALRESVDQKLHHTNEIWGFWDAEMIEKFGPRWTFDSKNLAPKASVKSLLPKPMYMRTKKS
ncbi:MAG: hypothetical protein M1829_001547 [Trizodia sp. TS-e1964]|nr:MAG: hypothetical protein M1829_001547 [Trizodia sp. TS-e1964]